MASGDPVSGPKLPIVLFLFAAALLKSALGKGGTEGENVFVNTRGLDEIRRIHVYAMIYDGVPQWNQTDAVVTVSIPGHQTIRVALGDAASREMMSVIASIERTGTQTGGTGLRVSRLATFHNGHAAADRAYGWGMRWQRGSK